MIFGSLSHTPYITQTQGDSHIFITDSGAIYEIYLIDGSSYFPEDTPFAPFTKVFGFKPFNGSGKNEYFDPRIGATVAKHVLAYFIDPLAVLLYTCDASDNRGAMRARLFNVWFLKYNEQQNPRLERIIIDAGGIDVIAVFRQDNPLKIQISDSLPDLEEKLE